MQLLDNFIRTHVPFVQQHRNRRGPIKQVRKPLGLMHEYDLFTLLGLGIESFGEQGLGDFSAQPAKIRPFKTSTGFSRI